MSFKFLGKKPPQSDSVFAIAGSLRVTTLRAEHFRGALKEASDALKDIEKLILNSKYNRLDNATYINEIEKMLRVSAGDDEE